MVTLPVAAPIAGACVLFGLPDTRPGEVPVAVARLRGDRMVEADVPRAFAVEWLARFKLPERI